MHFDIETLAYLLVALRPIVLSLSPQDPFGPATGAIESFTRKFKVIAHAL